MKKPSVSFFGILFLALFSLSLCLTLVQAAEEEFIQDDYIRTEAATAPARAQRNVAPSVPSIPDSSAFEGLDQGGSQSDQEEVVIVKKRPAPPKKRRVIIREVEEAAPAPQYAQQPQYQAQPQQYAPQQQNQGEWAPGAQAQGQQAQGRKGIGSALDQGVDNKLADVKDQFEQAILRTLDRIKVTVDEGQPAAPTSAYVQDQYVNNHGAPVAPMNAQQDPYLSIDKAPVMENTSVAEQPDEKFTGKFKVFPIFGFTSLKSDNYDVNSDHTLGFGIEADVDDNLAAVASYNYSQYAINLAQTNTYFGYNGYNQNNTNSLQYNQNVIDLGMRYYLFPKRSRFRLFMGAGIGYNKGYLNYKQNSYNQYNVISNDNQDYEVTSFLGQFELGGELSLSKTFSFGAAFKYNKVLSSKENQPLNNNGFLLNGYQPVTDKQRAGGSISDNDFYSLLASLKIAF